MRRRRFLQLGTGLAALGGTGMAGRWFLLPPRRSRVLAGADELAMRLVDGLSPEVAARACVPYEHPARQYHNRGVAGCGVDIDLSSFDRGSRAVLTDLFHAGLSVDGRTRLPNQFFLNWPGVHLMRLLVCGDPRRPPYQIVLSGPHLHLRLGGANREGVAFGGPQIYGDQRGNERPGLPGNVYRYQLDLGRALFDRLDRDQRRAVLLPRSPIQTRIEPRGTAGPFEGLPVAALGLDERERAGALVDAVLVNYPLADAEYARRCLDAHGGIGALHLAYYEDSSIRGGPYQNFRLEGPSAVFYFRGAPHVHAFVNVVMDAERPWSVGEELGRNTRALEGRELGRLFELALRSSTGADFGYYDEESLVGRLRAGTIRTGDVYVLESWQNRVVVVRVRGSALPSRFVAQLRERGLELRPSAEYTIATTDHVAESLPEALGAFTSRELHMPVRDALVAHLKAVGLPA